MLGERSVDVANSGAVRKIISTFANNLKTSTTDKPRVPSTIFHRLQRASRLRIPKMVSTSTIVTASVAATVGGLLAYAVYFDHRRRTDPDFRKELKRESRRQARAVREEAEADKIKSKESIKEAVLAAQAEGFPQDLESKEAYFMEEVSKGEILSQAGMDHLETALCFYRALKVYPQPGDLVSIYDKTVPRPVLDILSDMVALDPSLNHVARFGGESASDDGLPAVGLD